MTVDGSATGEIGYAGDRDWFAVELDAGETYYIDLKGRLTEDGTLLDPYLRGIHDAAGNLISGTDDDDGGTDLNSRVTFQPTETGTYYIAAGGEAYGTYPAEGTYTLSVEVL